MDKMGIIANNLDYILSVTDYSTSIEIEDIIKEFTSAHYRRDPDRIKLDSFQIMYYHNGQNMFCYYTVIVDKIKFKITIKINETIEITSFEELK
jgi:hypothetical protein